MSVHYPSWDPRALNKVGIKPIFILERFKFISRPMHIGSKTFGSKNRILEYFNPKDPNPGLLQLDIKICVGFKGLNSLDYINV